MCGEHLDGSNNLMSGTGSSPRVRGTLWCRHRRQRDAGIIPACAGNTCGFLCVWLGGGDHPRVCGEHPSRLARMYGLPGSSPRVRGTPVAHAVDQSADGIIPACAGNTVGCVACIILTGDHPRVCGEHLLLVMAILVQTGSSPRVRGTPKLSYVIRWLHGIIPACAGNTFTVNPPR